MMIDGLDDDDCDDNDLIMQIPIGDNDGKDLAARMMSVIIMI